MSLPSPVHETLRQVYAKFIKYQWIQPIIQPKNIDAPGGYASIQEAPATIMEGLIVAKQIANEARAGVQGPPTLRHTVATINYLIVQEQCPVYFANENFIRAVAATEMPNDLKIEELWWPRRAFTLALPQRFMLEYCGQDISYLTVANLKSGTYTLAPHFSNYPEIEAPLHRLGIHALLWNPHEKRPENAIVAWQQNDFLNQAAQHHAYCDMCGSSEIAVTYKKGVNDLLGHLVLKLLLILSTNTGYVTEGKLIREEKRDHKGRTVQKELWSPSWIGGAYKISGKREGGAYTPHEGFIRRSGHFTHQSIGARSLDFVSTGSLPHLSTGEIDWSLVPQETAKRFWEQHKRIWIEPVWYNPSEAK